jgi:hypothetical protein
MGKKFKELLNKTIASSKKIQLPLSATAKPPTTVLIDERWNESFHYHYLARFLPDFIEHYSLEQLKLTEKFTISSKKEQLGLLIRKKLNQENNKKKLLRAVNNCDIITIKRYFLPKKIEISTRAKEQYDDFIRRYYAVKSILQLKATYNTQLYSNGDIKIDQQMHSKAKSIFKDNFFNQDLFYEYFNAMPFLTDIYVSSGLEKYREDHLNFKTKSVNKYIKALGKLRSKQKNIGYRKTIRGLNLYREYHSHYLRQKKRRNHAPKAAAIQHLITSGKLEPVNYEDIVPSIKEIVRVYTAFFNFVEQSELNPFDTTKYLDYLHKRFPEVKSKRK